MAKHGIVTITEAGVTSFEAKTGLASVTAGIASNFSYQKAAVGLPGVYAKLSAFALGNVVATHSFTGRIGMAAAGRSYTI